MKQQTMSVLFYLNKAKTNQKGVCPIYCRITYFKERKQFSTGIFINPKNWLSKKQLVKSNEDNHDVINGQLQVIKSKLDKVYLTLLLSAIDFNAQNILDSYVGRAKKNDVYVLNNFKEYLMELQKLIGRDIKQLTYNKFNNVLKHVSHFVKYKYNKNDILLKELTPQFLDDLEYYLKTVKCQKQITINKVIQRFRKSIKIAISKGYLQSDPFILYKAKHVKKEVVFLTTEELQALEEFEFSQSRLALVKDLFVFSCYTGLAYNELSRLRVKHIIKGFDNNLWIQMKREKTNKSFSVPLLPKPLLIINKYKEDGDVVLPVISNQKYNSYLKEISAIVGIDKRLTTHTARRTFASTVLLYNNVPMEIVSELLGHSSLKVTQDSYGKIVQKKISEEMIRLHKILKVNL